MKSDIHRTKEWRTPVRLSYVVEIYKELLTIKKTPIRISKEISLKI